MMGARRLVALVAIAGGAGCGAFFDDDETTCVPGPHFEGPYYTLPKVAAAGDRFLVSWDRTDAVQSGPVDHQNRAVMVDASGAPIGPAFDLGAGIWPSLISGPDRALVMSGSTIELRDRDGARIAGPIDAPEVSQLGVFDGDAFQLSNARVELDGTIGAIAPPPCDDVRAMAATDAVIWLVCKGDGVVEAVRIARGGGVLDVTTIPAPDVAELDLAARAGSAALAIWTRVRDLSWVELADDGTIVGPTPVTPAPAPGVLVAEPDGYLLYAYEGWTAVRLSPAGNAAAPFDLFEPNNYTGNSREYAQSVDRAHTLLIYDWSSRAGTPSSIRARAIAPGAQQNPEVVVAEVPLADGEIVNVDCGCNAGGTGRRGSLAMLAVALLASRRRRTLR